MNSTIESSINNDQNLTGIYLATCVIFACLILGIYLIFICVERIARREGVFSDFTKTDQNENFENEIEMLNKANNTLSPNLIGIESAISSKKNSIDQPSKLSMIPLTSIISQTSIENIKQTRRQTKKVLSNRQVTLSLPIVRSKSVDSFAKLKTERRRYQSESSKSYRVKKKEERKKLSLLKKERQFSLNDDENSKLKTKQSKNQRTLSRL
jgi:hypothetical protein